MRIGPPNSLSYKRLQCRRRYRRRQAEAHLCHRLDHLVERAESLPSGRTRVRLLARADKVREQLRLLSH